MKKFLFLVLLSVLMTGVMSLEIQQFQLFDEGVIFTNENSFVLTEGLAYFAYTRNLGDEYEVVASIVPEDGSESISLTIGSTDAKSGSRGAVLDVDENGGVHFFYLNDGELRYVSIDAELETYNENTIANDVYTIPHIYRNLDGELNLIYNDHSGERVDEFEYFSENELPYYGDFEGDVYFKGSDTYYGRVHTNSDMWIRHDADGWPVFYGEVTVGGEVRVHPDGNSDFPEDEIFFGGLQENFRELEAASLPIQENGIILGSHSDTDIMHIKIDGTYYTAYRAHITIPEPTTYTVYDEYPPFGPIGEEIGVNEIIEPDTTWVNFGSGNIQDGLVYVPMELWISGDIEGRQAWGSSHDIYIVGDLTYTNTTPGERPDDIDISAPDFDPLNPELGSNFNETDHLHLQADGSIYIKYGHFCPLLEQRMKPNTQDIYLYGDFVAREGVFSFEYQFPKGSTLDQYWEDELYQNIDLHRFLITDEGETVWPSIVDFPYYSPLWPESGTLSSDPEFKNPRDLPVIVRDRGTINLFGSVSQNRRGFLYRDTGETFDTGYWDIDNQVFGDPNSERVGYELNNNFDFRITTNALEPLSGNITNNSFSHLKLVDDNFTEVGSFELPIIDENFPIYGILEDEIVGFNNQHEYVLINETDYPIETVSNNPMYKIQDIAIDNNVWYLTKGNFNEDNQEEDFYRLFHADDFNSSSEELVNLDYGDGFGSIVSDGYGNLYFFEFEFVDILRVYKINNEGIVSSDIFSTGISPGIEFNDYNSSLYVNIEGDQLHLVFFAADHANPEVGEIYFARGEIEETSTSEPIVSVPELHLSYYPNPFNPNINIDFSLKQDERIKLEVYNLRGQRIKTLLDSEFTQGEHSIKWNGLSDKGEAAPSGVYFLRLQTDNSTETAKIMLLK